MCLVELTTYFSKHMCMYINLFKSYAKVFDNMHRGERERRNG